MTADARPSPERLALTTADGLRLRAEWLQAVPEPTSPQGDGRPFPTVVLCHPHPLHGGNMHATVIDRLFWALPNAGIPALRFNFRGVQGSDGRHDHGNRERFDVLAAVDLAAQRRPDTPVRLIGWSFGADLALATSHPSLDGWTAIAPPLRVIEPGDMAAATDGRPAHLIVGEHDAFRPPSEAGEITADWSSATVTEVAGADHFFSIGLDTVIDLVTRDLLPD